MPKYPPWDEVNYTPEGLYLPINSQGVLDRSFSCRSSQGIFLNLDDMDSPVSYGSSNIFSSYILSVWEWEVKAMSNFLSVAISTSEMSSFPQ